MSEQNQTEETAPKRGRPAKPKVTKVRAVYGLMVHPFAHHRFDRDLTVELEEVDNWTRVQIEAGKLEIVE